MRNHPVTFWLAQLSGVRRSALLRAPDAIHLAATSGAIMLLTAAFAISTMGYALQRAFAGDSYATPVAIAGGLLWGAFILTLDRLLLMGIDKTARWYYTIAQLLIRIPIAVVLGMVISKPLTLRVTRTLLDLRLRDEQIAGVDKDRNRFERVEDLRGKQLSVEELKKQKGELETLVHSEPNSFEYKEAQNDVSEADARHSRIRAANNRKIANAQRLIYALERSENPNDLLRVQRLRGDIGAWWAEVSRAANDVVVAKRHVGEVAQAWVEEVRAKLDRTTRELAAAEQRLGEAGQRIKDGAGKSDAELAELLRTNLVNEYTALEHIKNDPSHPNRDTVKKIERGLDAIFIMFELAPLFSKVFSRTNALDRTAAAIEEEDENRINHAMNAAFDQQQKMFEIGLDLFGEAAERYAAGKSQFIQQNPMTIRDLHDLSDEIAPA